MKRSFFGTFALLAALSFTGTACTEREAEIDRGVGYNTEPAEESRLSGGVEGEEGGLVEEREVEIDE